MKHPSAIGDFDASDVGPEQASVHSRIRNLVFDRDLLGCLLQMYGSSKANRSYVKLKA